MWKKIFSIAVLFSVICASAMAAKNPATDENLVLFHQRQGLENYLLKNSLRVTEKDSLKVVFFDYIIFDSIQPENTRWNDKKTMAFAYNESAHKIYFFDANGGLSFISRNNTAAQGGDYVSGAEMVYRLIFGKDFYLCPTYLDAEKNYVLYADLGGQGAGLYVDKNSLNVIQKDWSGYIISIDTVEVSNAAEGKTEIVNRYTHHYSYNTEKKVVMRFIDEEDKWVKVNPSITNLEDENFTYDATIAEIAYYLATGKNFLGTFDENFYNVLPRDESYDDAKQDEPNADDEWVELYPGG